MYQYGAPVMRTAVSKVVSLEPIHLIPSSVITALGNEAVCAVNQDVNLDCIGNSSPCPEASLHMSPNKRPEEVRGMHKVQNYNS